MYGIQVCVLAKRSYCALYENENRYVLSWFLSMINFLFDVGSNIACSNESSDEQIAAAERRRCAANFEQRWVGQLVQARCPVEPVGD